MVESNEQLAQTETTTNVAQVSIGYFPTASLLNNWAMSLARWLWDWVLSWFAQPAQEVVAQTGTPASGETWMSYYYAGGQRIAMRVNDGTNNNVYYPLTDHLGSTSVVVDENGDYYSELRYKPWGEVRYENGVTPTDYTYTGQKSNGYIKLIDMGGTRWYDPYLGRFTTADTIIPGAGDPASFDRYHYSRNNPVRFVDPTGHRSCTAEQAAAGDETCDQNSTSDPGDFNPTI